MEIRWEHTESDLVQLFMIFRLSSLLLLLAALSVNGLPAAGLIIVTEPGLPDTVIPPDPSNPVQRRAPARVLELVRYHVNAGIEDQFASTHIEQGFHNPTTRRLEGTFLFPVPKGARLKNFTMEIDGKPVEAELLASSKARKIYEDIVRRQRDPALLEYVDQDLFKVRIFPIEPDETKRITVSYEQLLESDFGLVNYTCPMSVQKFSAKPVKDLSLSLSLKTGPPLKTVYSPTHEVEVIRQGERAATIGYEANALTSGNDFQLFFSRDEDEIGMSLLTYRPDEGEDGYFLLLASPGLQADSGKVLPKDVVFVVDTSGSMANGKLEQAREALVFCIQNLNREDRFEVIQFATDVNPLFGGMRTIHDQTVKQAVEWVERLRPRGGTAIDAALTTALKRRDQAEQERPFMVVFLTDGLPTVGENNIQRIVSNVEAVADDRIRVYCFGIGHDVNTHLLDQITETTRAVSEYVLPKEDLEVKVSNFFARVSDPVLINPELTFPDGVRANKILPNPLPDIFSGEQLVTVGRYHSGAKGAVQLTGVAGGREIRLAEDVTFARESDDHPFIARLWATRRIAWLINETRLRGESDELKEEITRLARRHGVVTPYTAWLIVEDEERRQVETASRTLRPTARNSDALDYSRDSYRRLSADQTGADAALSARYGAGGVRTKTAAAPAADASAYDERFFHRYGLTSQPATSSTPAASPRDLPSDLAKQARVVDGKTFFLTDDRWVDAEIQQHAGALEIKITFNSDAYFELVRNHPPIAKWLTLGTRVRFYFEGAIYEIE